MKCTLCGSPLDPGVTRCDVCGTPVGPQAAPVASPLPTPAATRQEPSASGPSVATTPVPGPTQGGHPSPHTFAPTPPTIGRPDPAGTSPQSGVPLWAKVSAAGVVAAGLIWVFASGSSGSDAPDQPDSVAPAAPAASGQGDAGVPATPETPDPEPTPTEDPRDVAYAALEAQVAADAALNPVRNQWVAVIDSKYEGLVDPVIQADPFTVEQIQQMHEEHRANPEWGSLVRLLHNGDWGERKKRTFMWVTIVDLDASSKDEVTAWCRSNRPGPPGDPDHFCVGFQMKTPYG